MISIAHYTALSSEELIEHTKQLLQDVRNNLVRVMINLYFLREKGGWEGRADTWGELCERDFGMSQGYASKLYLVAKHYIFEGGVKPEQLAGIDHEALYLARKIEGDYEDQVLKAKELRRSDIKKSMKGPCLVPDWVSYCAKCGVSQENHDL
jgi:hypothetical protein